MLLYHMKRAKESYSCFSLLLFISESLTYLLNRKFQLRSDYLKEKYFPKFIIFFPNFNISFGFPWHPYIFHSCLKRRQWDFLAFFQPWIFQGADHFGPDSHFRCLLHSSGKAPCRVIFLVEHCSKSHLPEIRIYPLESLNQQGDLHAVLFPS